jgi:hypothetical protein
VGPLSKNKRQIDRTTLKHHLAQSLDQEMMVASTASLTTLASVISLVVWLYALAGLTTRIAAR